MSLVELDKPAAGNAGPDFFEVVVSCDGGNTYVRYAQGMNDETEAREYFDHHVHQMREAMREHRHTATVIVELLNHERVVESSTMQSVKSSRPLFKGHTDRPELGDMSIAAMLAKYKKGAV